MSLACPSSSSLVRSHARRSGAATRSSTSAIPRTPSPMTSGRRTSYRRPSRATSSSAPRCSRAIGWPARRPRRVGAGARGAHPDDEWTKDELPEAIAGDVVIRPEMFAGDWLAGPPPLPYVRGVKWCHLEAWYDQLTVRADFAHVQHRTLRHGMLALDGLADVPFTDERHLLWFPPKTRIPGRSVRCWT